MILLATNDYLVSKYGKFPDAWYIKNADGSKMRSYADGFGLLNITNDCPRVDNGYGAQKFNEFLPRFLLDKTDWNYFDGVFFDYWANQVWSGADRADLNNDGKADGKETVNRKWEEGNQNSRCQYSHGN